MNGSKQTQKDYKALLPQRFLAKMQKISNQIDFINKYFLIYQEQLKFYKQESSTMANNCRESSDLQKCSDILVLNIMIMYNN